MQNTKSKLLLATIVATLLSSVCFQVIADTKCPSGDEQFNNLLNIGKDDTVVTVDHRGGMTDVIPENTKAAFKSSYDNCRHAIETDVRITKDGTLVIFHDESIGRLLTNYDPMTNKGPNYLITNTNSSDLLGKRVKNIRNDYTDEKVISLKELLQYYVDVDGKSFIYLDLKFKGIPNLMKVLDDIVSVASIKNQEYLYKRVVVKFSMDLVPTYEQWQDILKQKKINTPIMANPYISPWAKVAINRMDEIPLYPGDTYKDNTSRAVASWSRQSGQLVPNVEVVIKNSDDFIKVTESESIQGKYLKPINLSEDNAMPGTMAAMVTIVKKHKKALGLFVPVPDYIEWHPNILTRNVTVRHAFDNRQIDIEEAFYTNRGRCCTTIKEKLDSGESGDIRNHLAWGRSLGVNVITVDDPSSVDKFHRDNGDLDKIAIPNIVPTDIKMNSILARQLEYYPNPKMEVIDMQVWGGGPGGGWGDGPVCIWDNTVDSDHYAWIYHCGDDPVMDEYHRGVVLKLIKNHETLPYVGVATQIYTADMSYCLSIQTTKLNMINWIKDCDPQKNYDTLFLKDGMRLYPLFYDQVFNGELNNYITSKYVGKWWVTTSYGGLEVYPISDDYLNDSWGIWNFVAQ